MIGGYRVKLTSHDGMVVVHGILKYSDDFVYIVRDDYGHEEIYPTRLYIFEREVEGI